MKRIVFFSPVPLQESSGISIRIDELKSQFEKLDIKTVTIDTLDKYKEKESDYLYIMVSTKNQSISANVVDSTMSKNLIVDLYTPIFLEKEISLSNWNPIDWFIKYKNKQNVKKIISAGKYFFVANKRQKEYWLKTTNALNVPIEEDKIFVLPTGAPKPSTINHQPSTIILWFGGIYPWMNPYPLVKAFRKVRNDNKGWKLRFLGGFHPSTGYQDIFKKVIKEAQKKIPSDALEIIPWQSSIDLPHYLKDVAFAVNMPRNLKEDYFAHRVRLLTLLNSGIPIITSGNDLISNLLDKEKAGMKIEGTTDITESLNMAIKQPPLLKTWSRNALRIQGKLIESQDEFSKFKSIITNNEG